MKKYSWILVNILIGFIYFSSISCDFNPAPPEAPGPVLSVQPTVLDFGTSDNPMNFRVSNTGEGELDWEVIVYQNWITCTPVAGYTTDIATVTVTIDKTGLKPWTYNGTVEVTCKNGGLEYVTVLMTIPPDTGGVSGNVYSEVTGDPLEGVVVSITGHPESVSTDSDGYYLISDVSPGTKDISFQKTGYHNKITKINIVTGQVVTFNINLEPE
jgi:hypothetical protein